jgi:hypothetical protein
MFLDSAARQLCHGKVTGLNCMPSCEAAALADPWGCAKLWEGKLLTE